MQIQELGHVVLNVRNLEDSLGFYRDRLGLHITGEMGRAAFLAGAAGPRTMSCCWSRSDLMPSADDSD